jgi:hypothetical protein
VYHFQTVTWVKGRFSPAVAGQDFEISLHGHPVGGQLQPLEQAGDGQVLGYFLRLTVQMDGNQNLISASPH